MLVPGAADWGWIKIAIACQACGRQETLGLVAQGAAQPSMDRHSKAHLGSLDQAAWDMPAERLAQQPLGDAVAMDGGYQAPIPEQRPMNCFFFAGLVWPGYTPAYIYILGVAVAREICHHSWRVPVNDIGPRFKFGRNWLRYSKTIDEMAAASATDGLKQLLRGHSLTGKRFLDIGCGSGLHSIAASRLGAGSVTAFDYDADSVEATRRNFARFSSLAQPTQSRGNILHHNIRGTFDVVYSWGVLHHTGDMWQAISNSAQLVEDDGLLVIAIYKKTRLCGAWTAIKRLYSNSGPSLRFCMAAVFLTPLFLGKILTRQKFTRGMSWYYDAIDWLGGYPYQSATPDEIVEFVGKAGFAALATVNTGRIYGIFGSNCAEYIFRKI